MPNRQHLVARPNLAIKQKCTPTAPQTCLNQNTKRRRIEGSTFLKTTHMGYASDPRNKVPWTSRSQIRRRPCEEPQPVQCTRALDAASKIQQNICAPNKNSNPQLPARTRGVDAQDTKIRSHITQESQNPRVTGPKKKKKKTQICTDGFLGPAHRARGTTASLVCQADA